MISTDKEDRTTQIFINKQSKSFAKPKLKAHWSTVDGQLVCQWTEV